MIVSQVGFLAAGDEAAILAWFRMKPLVACLVAEQDGLAVGVARLWDAAPGLPRIGSADVREAELAGERASCQVLPARKPALQLAEEAVHPGQGFL